MSACDWDYVPNGASAETIAKRILAIRRATYDNDWTGADELPDLACRLARRVLSKPKRRKGGKGV